MINSKRVAVFIDNSNVFHSIKRHGNKYISRYNPYVLAEKLAGNRRITYVGFYCVHPPAYLLNGNNEEKKHYNAIKKYYSQVENISNISIKYGYLSGSRGNLKEKNVDTQLSVDMVVMAALDKYDVAILVSNDGDYKSAIDGIKIFDKKIENLFFKGSLSEAINSVCDVKRKARPSFFVKLE